MTPWPNHFPKAPRRLRFQHMKGGRNYIQITDVNDLNEPIEKDHKSELKASPNYRFCVRNPVYLGGSCPYSHHLGDRNKKITASSRPAMSI